MLFLLFLKGKETEAEMAELVDALASGASARKGMEVRVLFSAQKRVGDRNVSSQNKCFSLFSERAFQEFIFYLFNL